MLGKQKSVEKNNSNKRILFLVELCLAIILSVACGLIGMSNLLTVSKDLFPDTSDAMGHMTKVVYIAEQLSMGHIPSWFPYWYNGATTTQYYVPLSYYLMAPIYLLTDNVMMTYQIFCASMMSIGGFGVWLFSYKKIGRLCGLIAILAFCFQPMLLGTLYGAGAVAQGTIIAVMPYFLLAILSLVNKPSRSNYIGCTLLTVLLILSHAMNAFTICLTTAMVLVLLVILKKITFRNLIITGTSIVFAGAMTAFWSMVGATKLENPSIPYLLPESSYDGAYTANIHWFIPGDKSAIFHFSYITSAMIVIAALLYLLLILTKKLEENLKYTGLAVILLSVVTVIFSFGMIVPGFHYLPMAGSLVSGRILTFTSIAAAICAAFVFHVIWSSHKMIWFMRVNAFLICAFIAWGMNPLDNNYRTLSSDNFNKMSDFLDTENSAFNKGRYQWYSAVNSSETYFGVLHDYNLSDGWNVEGTVHNRTIWNNNIAFALNDKDYILKQLAYWNVRYLLVNNQYQGFTKALENEALGFEKQEVTRNEDVSLYISDQPSSYYLQDPRNALIIGDEMQGFGIAFPNLVQGKSKHLTDYTLEELTKYKMIYIIEPVIDTLKKKTEFEAMVTELVNQGIAVIIEPSATKNFDIFGVNSKEEDVNSTPQFTITADSPYDIEAFDILENEDIRTIRSLFDLDEVYGNFITENGSISNAMIGAKKVGSGEVIFVGAHLSQYLEPVFARNYGFNLVTNTVTENSKLIESIYLSLFSYYEVEMEFLPETYPSIIEHQWDYQGGSFTYSSEEEKEVTISVTYTPRWTAVLDGNLIEIGQRENLITLMLPAGEHTVELHYGVTIYGKIGYLISVIGLCFFLIFILLWKYVMLLVDKTSMSLIAYLQLDANQGEVDPRIWVNGEFAATLQELPEDMVSKTVPVYKTEGYGSVHQAFDETDKEDNISEDNSYPFIYQKTIDDNGIMVDIIEMEEDNALEPDKSSQMLQYSDEDNINIPQSVKIVISEQLSDAWDKEMLDNNRNQYVEINQDNNIDYDVYDWILDQARRESKQNVYTEDSLSTAPTTNNPYMPKRSTDKSPTNKLSNKKPSTLSKAPNNTASVVDVSKSSSMKKKASDTTSSKKRINKMPVKGKPTGKTPNQRKQKIKSTVLRDKINNKKQYIHIKLNGK